MSNLTPQQLELLARARQRAAQSASSERSANAQLPTEQRVSQALERGLDPATERRQQDIDNRTAEEAGISPAAPAEQQPGMMDTIRRNVIGGSELGQETMGERAGAAINEFGQSFFPGVARGAMELAGLPGTISDGMDWVAERAGLIPEGAAPGNPLSGSALRGHADNLTGGATEFRGDSTAAKFGGTIGEFMPGAMGAGAKGMLAYGAIPGAASEGAGQLTEGTQAEPYARIAAALTAGLGAGAAIGPRAPSVRTPGASEGQRAIAESLQAQGINPTAGQISNSPMLRRLEGTVTPRPEQTAAVTRSAMRSLGSEADRVTPATLRTARDQITGAMDDALQGVSIRPSPTLAQNADSVVAQYLTDAPSASVVPRVRAIADEIIDTATNPAANPIELSTLRTWRSALGRMSQSNDEATRSAAHGLRRIIDDATDEALRTANRSDDITRLATAREQYRNYLAVSDASTRAGSEAGILSPSQLNQSVIRTQGRDAYAVGRGTDLMETSRNAGSMLRPMPTVEAGGVRRLPGLPEASGTGLGAYAGYALSGGNPAGAVVGGLLGMSMPAAGQSFMRSGITQRLLNNPHFAAGNAARTAPGILSRD